MFRVLVADDEPIERAVVGKKIQKFFSGQIEVVPAANGREAVTLFFEKECHAALLDIEMPGVNGLEAAAQIRERDQMCSIIFLTAFDEFDYAKRAINVHALDYLLKPGSDEELIAALEEAMRLEREQRRQTKGAEMLETVNDSKTDNIRMNAVAEMIREYIANQYMEDISLQTVAEAMNYSEAYFCKIFKQCFDKSFVAYLTDYRMERARKLLADVTINVKDISRRVGYHDSNYFAKVFKRVTGVTPTDYRMQVLGGADK